MIESKPVRTKKHTVTCDHCGNTAVGYADLDAFMSELDLAGWECYYYYPEKNMAVQCVINLKAADRQFCSRECFVEWCKKHKIKHVQL